MSLFTRKQPTNSTKPRVVAPEPLPRFLTHGGAEVHVRASSKATVEDRLPKAGTR